MLEDYENHVAERAELGIVPKPLDAEQTAALVELLKAPPQSMGGREQLLLELIANRVPAGVDQAAYIKAAFLAAIVRGEEVVMASRELVIESNDHVVIFADRKKRIPDIEKLFQVSATFL